MRTWSKLSRYLSSHKNRRVTLMRLLLVMCSGGAISVIFVSGPYIQTVFTTFVAGDNSSLYAGMFGASAVDFPTLSNYIQGALWVPYILTGMAVALAASWINTKRGFLVGVSLVSAIGLTIIDIMNSANTFHVLLVSAACNVLGGVVLALLMFVVVANISVVKVLAGSNVNFERVLWVLWPATCYLLFAGIPVFLLAFLIKIPKSSVSIRLSSPVGGYVSPVDPMQCAANSSTGDTSHCFEVKAKEEINDENNFGVLKNFKPVKGGGLRLIGLGEKLSLSWDKKNKSRVTESFRIVQGCTTVKQFQKMMSIGPLQKGVDVSERVIHVNNGALEIKIVSPSYTDAVHLIELGSRLYVFGINPSTKNPSKVDVNRFMRGGSLNIRDDFQPMSYALSIYIGNNKNGLSEHRRVTFFDKSSGKSKFIDVTHLDSVDPNGPVVCKAIELTPVAGGYNAVADSPILNLIVTIHHEKEVAYSDLYNPDSIKISGINGWVESDSYPLSSMKSFIQPGKIGMLSVTGSFSDVHVNDRTIDAGHSGTLKLTGSLVGIPDGSSILVSGDADFMSINKHRLTMTRWESLNTALRVALIVGMPAMLIFVLRLLGISIRKPMRRLWYIPD